MTYVTYAHYKPDGSIFYIGKGSVKRAHSAVGRNIVWKRTVEKHGNFRVEILGKWAVEQDAFDHEIALIDEFRKNGCRLSNIASGGMGSTGFRHTDAHKESLRKMFLERNPMVNLELRAKQLIALRLAMQRPEVREHQRAARIGKKFSTAHIESLKLCHPMRACIINGKEYKSLMFSSRCLGIRHGTIHRWLSRPEINRGKKYSYITECRWK